MAEIPEGASKTQGIGQSKNEIGPSQDIEDLLRSSKKTRPRAVLCIHVRSDPVQTVGDDRHWRGMAFVFDGSKVSVRRTRDPEQSEPEAELALLSSCIENFHSPRDILALRLSTPAIRLLFEAVSKPDESEWEPCHPERFAISVLNATRSGSHSLKIPKRSRYEDKG